MTNVTIKVNNAGQRILIIDEDNRFANVRELPDEVFDAIYFDCDERYTYKMIHAIRESNAHKIYLKPIFVNTSVKSTDNKTYVNQDEELVDGFVSGIEDTILTRQTDIINETVENFTTIDDLPEYNTITVFIIQILRYYFSRNMSLIPVRNRLAQFGYSQQFVRLFYDNQHTDYLFEIQKAFHDLYKDGYLNAEFFDRVHLCPKCSFGFLNFRETCPKCDSANIHSGKMIHHFVCANVSPEEDYIKDNMLICPKCRRQLRHIGVDYDRPSNLSSCNSCGTSFLHPKMVASCFNCGQGNELESLTPLDIYSYSFNDKTMDLIINPDISQLDKTKIIFPGYIAYDMFVQQVFSQLSFIKERSKEQSLVIAKIKANLQEKDTPLTYETSNELLHFISTNLRLTLDSNYLMTYNLSSFYVLFINKSLEEVSGMWKRDEAIVKERFAKKYANAASLHFEPKLLEFTKEKNINSFMDELNLF